MTLPLPLRILGPLSRVTPGAAGELAGYLFTKPRRYTASAWEEIASKNAIEERLRDGTRLFHFGDCGPRVVAIHGWEGRATQLAPLARSLAQAGMRVTTVDGPAHGASPGKVAHPVAFALTLARVAHHFGDVEAIVGHSMGGGAALIAVREEGVSARAVVIIAGSLNFTKGARRFARFVALSPLGEEAFVASLERRVGRQAMSMDAISEPTLIFHDPQDREVPFTDAQEVAARLPHAKLVPMPGAGHRAILRAPELLDRATRFLHDALVVKKEAPEGNSSK